MAHESSRNAHARSEKASNFFAKFSERVKDLAAGWVSCIDNEPQAVLDRFYEALLEMMHVFEECYLFESLKSAGDPTYRYTRPNGRRYPMLTTTIESGWKIHVEDRGGVVKFDVRAPDAAVALCTLAEIKDAAIQTALTDATSLLRKGQPVWYWRQRVQAWVPAVVIIVDSADHYYQVQAEEQGDHCDTERYRLRARLSPTPPRADLSATAPLPPSSTALTAAKAGGEPLQHEAHQAEVLPSGHKAPRRKRRRAQESLASTNRQRKQHGCPSKKQQRSHNEVHDLTSD